MLTQIFPLESIPYEGATFGASSRWSGFPAANAFTHSSWRPWHAGSWQLPQLIFITFPKKQRVSEISFEPRIDWPNRDQAAKKAPKDVEIWATNEEDLTEMDQLMNPTRWKKLARITNIKWGRETNYVGGTKIENRKRGLYFTYGIYIKSVSTPDYVSLSKITLKRSENHPGVC